MFSRSNLPDRLAPICAPPTHAVSGVPIAKVPEGFVVTFFGMGCFWGAERRFWQTAGVYSTAVGYQGGRTTHPTYEDVCTGASGHAEVVRVVFDPAQVSFDDLLAVFFEAHDPTQGDRQGNDRGSQYRSAIFTTSAAQHAAAEACRAGYAERLQVAGYSVITTAIETAPPFYYAELHHQQYLHKNPGGYCGLRGTGVRCAE